MRIPAEVRFGFFLLLFAGILIFVYFRLGYWRYTPRGYEIYVHFQELKGLTAGSQVLLLGQGIGFVKATGYDSEKGFPFALLFIQEAYKIPIDSKFYVGIEAMIGEPRVMIQPGSSKEFLAHGVTVPSLGEARPTFEDLVAELTYQVKELTDSIQGTMAQVNAVVSQLQLLVQRLADPVAQTAEQLPALVSEIRSTVLTLEHQVEMAGEQIQNVSEEARSSIASIRAQLSRTLEKLDTTAERIQSIVENIQSTVEEKQILDDLAEAVNNLKKISENIEKLSEILAKPETREAISSTLQSAQRIAQKVQKGVEETAAIQTSLETQIYSKESEKRFLHRIHLEIFSEESPWYALIGEEQVGGKTRNLWYVGGRFAHWKLGAGRRRGETSVELGWTQKPWELEAAFWFPPDTSFSARYQALFAIQLRQYLSLLAGVEKEKEPRAILGIKAEF